MKHWTKWQDTKGYRIVTRLTQDQLKELYNRIEYYKEITESGCWVSNRWHRDKKGHQTIKFGGYNWRPPRISAAYHKGIDINDSSIQVKHHCSNHSCWNPKHLRIILP